MDSLRAFDSWRYHARQAGIETLNAKTTSLATVVTHTANTSATQGANAK